MCTLRDRSIFPRRDHSFPSDAQRHQKLRRTLRLHHCEVEYNTKELQSLYLLWVFLPSVCGKTSAEELVYSEKNMQKRNSQRRPNNTLVTKHNQGPGKEPTCQCRRQNRRGYDPWVRKIPWRRAWQPTPVFLPGEAHG